MDIPFDQDTICAIATPPGEGGIGIVRMSGPRAHSICETLFHPRYGSFPLRSHRLYYGWIKDPHTHTTVDEVLVSHMAAPRTYTREDLVEINCHSGYAVLQRILELVLRAGARMAEPGEFTRRAFLNGRIDLSQAEAIADVIQSRCEKSLEVAGRHLEGALGNKVQQWQESLLQLEAETEAFLDFSEDLHGDDGESSPQRSAIMRELLEALKAAIQESERGRVLREGLTLALVGKPNAGKSSLLNALVGRDRAIVTPFPGTTRDVIEDSFILSGVQVRILDTAGIRHGPGTIESLGIERTLSSVQQADVVLWLMDQSRPLDDQDDLVHQCIGHKVHRILLNKKDLEPRMTSQEVEERYHPSSPPLPLSTFHREDLERLRHLLAREFVQKPLEGFESMIVPNVRQGACLREAHEALEKAARLMDGEGFGELIILELERARKKLDEILGGGEDEDVLDRIFSQFCIGK